MGRGHAGDALRLTVLGSGSRGNALLVEAGGDALLVDAGFSFRDLLRRIAAARLETGLVRAIALTHEHGDHSRGAARAAWAWGVPVCATAGTLAALADGLAGIETVPLPASRPVTRGAFRLTSFPTAHDAADPAVLVVEDPDGRRLGVAYDVGSPTAALSLACRDLDALVLETNHDEVMLRASGYPPSVRARIAGRGGHLSNRQAAALAAEVAHSGLEVLVLAHLSDRCNTPELAREAVEQALAPTAFRGALMVAAQDAPLPPVDVGGGPGQLSLALRRR